MDGNKRMDRNWLREKVMKSHQHKRDRDSVACNEVSSWRGTPTLTTGVHMSSLDDTWFPMLPKDNPSNFLVVDHLVRLFLFAGQVKCVCVYVCVCVCVCVSHFVFSASFLSIQWLTLSLQLVLSMCHQWRPAIEDISHLRRLQHQCQFHVQCWVQRSLSCCLHACVRVSGPQGPVDWQDWK